MIQFCSKPTQGVVVFEKDPEKLVDLCLHHLKASLTLLSSYVCAI